MSTVSPHGAKGWQRYPLARRQGQQADSKSRHQEGGSHSCLASRSCFAPEEHELGMEEADQGVGRWEALLV